MTDPTFANVNYRPAGTQNPYQKMHIFVPTGTPPAAGWPALIDIAYSGFDTTSIPATIETASELAFEAYNNGFAVVTPMLTLPNVAGVAEQGMYWRPEDPDFDIEGGQADMPHLDVLWVIQKLRLGEATYGIDMDNWFGHAVSAGSEALGWALMSDDFADAGSAIPQVQQSTQDGLRGFLHSLTQGHLTVFPTTQPPALATIKHLRKSGATTLPAVQAVDTIAGHLTSSAWGYRMVQSDVLDKNALIPHYMRAGQKAPGFAALGTVDFTINGTTLLPTFAGSPSQGIQDVHDAYFQVIARQQLSAMSPLQDVISRLVAPISWTVAGVSPDSVITTLTDFASDAVEWMLAILESGATATTINLRMDWSNDIEVACTGIQTPRSRGMVQRRQTATVVAKQTEDRAIRRWSINWKNASRSEHDQILESWHDAMGPVRPITFFPPGGGSVTARFVGDSFRTRQVNPQTFALSVAIEEMP